MDHSITGSMLSTGKQALKYFFHLHFDVMKPIKEAAAETVAAVKEFWERSRIPTQKDQRARDKILRIYGKWRALNKKTK